MGARDRRPEGGAIEPACSRHAEPGSRVRHVCMYCLGSMRPGGVDVDGDNAHGKVTGRSPDGGRR